MAYRIKPPYPLFVVEEQICDGRWLPCHFRRCPFRKLLEDLIVHDECLPRRARRMKTFEEANSIAEPQAWSLWLQNVTEDHGILWVTA